MTVAVQTYTITDNGEVAETEDVTEFAEFLKNMTEFVNEGASAGTITLREDGIDVVFAGV